MKFFEKSTKRKDSWAFDDSKDVAVFTTRHVMLSKHPILYVYHDEDDGAWQFHSGDESLIEDSMVVALAEVVDIDPTITQVADLPLGWMAWRANIDEQWQRKINK